jgi:head-tail adaptor
MNEIRLGDLNEVIRFVRRAKTQRADGGYDTSETALGEAWAAVKPVEAREGEQAGRLFGSTSYLLTIHADDRPSGLTVDDHLVWVTGPSGEVTLNLRAIRQAGSAALFLELVGEAGAVL